MKKLTAGIFATILGVTAMGAADAAVTSKGYVDEAVKAVAGSVTALSTTVSNTYATKQALETAESTLQKNIDDVSAVADAAAPQATTYTKTEVDQAIAKVDGATAIAGLEGEIATIKLEQATQNTNITNLQNDKANKSDLKAVATTGAYADLTGTPDLSDMATQTWVEGKGYLTEHQSLADYAKTADVNAELALKATKTELTDYAKTADVEATYATKTEISGMATQGWVEGKDYATNTALTTGLAGKQANLSDAQLKAVNSGITTDKISAMDKATADAQADATQALTDAGNAQTAADAANAALNTASKLSDGQYALTMKVVEGVTSYGWELIDREYVSTDVTPNGQ